MSNQPTPQINVQALVSKPMLERLITATCMYYGITEKELIEGSSTDITSKKHLCWYLIKENVVISNYRIAQRFQICNHSTVTRSIEKIMAHKNIYAPTLHDINEITKLANTLA